MITISRHLLAVGAVSIPLLSFATAPTTDKRTLSIIQGVGLAEGKLKWRELQIDMPIKDVEALLKARLPLKEELYADKPTGMFGSPAEFNGHKLRLTFSGTTPEATLIRAWVDVTPDCQPKKFELFKSKLKKKLPGSTLLEELECSASYTVPVSTKEGQVLVFNQYGLRYGYRYTFD